MYFWCCPAAKLAGHSLLHLIWLLTTQKPFNQSVTHLRAIPNCLVETKWVTLREAQRKCFSAVCKETGPCLWPFLAQEVNQAFGGWDLTVPLLLSVAEGRQGEAGEIESWRGVAWWILSEIPAAVPPTLLRTKGCLWWEWICCSACLYSYGTRLVHNPELHSLYHLAALQHSGLQQLLLPFVLGSRPNKSVSVWERCKGVCPEKCCICEKVQDTCQVRQILTEVAAK